MDVGLVSDFGRPFASLFAADSRLEGAPSVYDRRRRPPPAGRRQFLTHAP